MTTVLDRRQADLERENSELRRQLEERSAELHQASEQQTATTEVLQVINSSPGDPKPVFAAMVERAARLCEADEAALRTFDGELLHLGSVHGSKPEVVERLWQLGPTRLFGLYEAFARGETVVHFADVRETDIFRNDPVVRERLELRGIRSWLAVALQKDGVLLGVINVHRHTVRPFTGKQIALLQNFAAQAVIAMENARLLTETREALAQQTATAEVLQVINSSPGDLTPVFDAILEKAHTLCGADYGALLAYDGKRFHPVAGHGRSAGLGEVIGKDGFLPPTDGALWKLTRGEPFAQIDDMAKLAEQRSDDPLTRALVETGGIRTQLVVPLRKDETLLGAITANRYEVRPFSDKQIALLQNFAAQAVIAMENARLITETREALEQQTATAEVLQVINSSPGALRPVFDAMLDKAMRLCQAVCGHLYTYDGEHFSPAAVRGDRGFAEWWEQHGAVRPLPGAGPLGRIVQGERVVVTDYLEDPAYRAIPQFKALVDAGSLRSAVAVALRKDDALLGSIHIYRQEVRPFSEKQIALLQNFAAQAVIAIENARLLTETREALEQQTATAEVLQVINSSPGDLAPVFDAILDKSMQFSEAAFGLLWTYDGEFFHAAALRNLPEVMAEFAFKPYRAGPRSGLGRLVRTRKVVRIADLAGDEAYLSREPGPVATVELGGFHSYLAIPLLKDGSLVGAINLFRRDTRLFSDPQIELLQNFAAQAVIAIENARLITETREALEQQTATAEVLQVINSSPGDLAPVFDAMLEKAMRLCEAAFGELHVYDGERYNPAALRGVPPAHAEFRTRNPITHGPGTLTGRIRDGADVLHVLDLKDEEAYRSGDPHRRSVVDLGGARTSLTVALRKGRFLLGLIMIYRQEVRPFSEKQIALLQNFAAQAVIAMENARLLGEIRTARDSAQAALRELSAAQASLIHAEKMASLGQLTAGIAHEIKNPLNFVNNFSGLSVELLDDLRAAAAPAIDALDAGSRAEIDETIAMLTGNLDKIAEHGRRADGIVKSMLDHSRSTSGELQSVDINAVVEEALNLAYHGARAQDQNFNITLERDFVASLPAVELVLQDMTRVFLNLFGNGFYATSKRRNESKGAAFEPRLKVTTRDLGAEVEIRVRDNGTGIAPEFRDKLFQPFFTTKPTGEGTGLGLSISWDIVTQQHGGTITVDSRVGEFTEFTIRLPRRAAPGIALVSGVGAVR